MAINWRLALGYGTLSSAVLAGLLGLSYGFYAQELYNGIDRVLLRAAELTAPAARQGQDLEPLINRNTEVLTVVRLYDARGRFEKTTRPWISDELSLLVPAQVLGQPSGPAYEPLRLMPSLQPPLWKTHEGVFTVLATPSGRWRVLLRPLSNPPAAPLVGYVEVLAPLAQPDRAITHLGWLLLALGVGGSLLSLGFGFLMAHRALRPVHALTKAAQQIAASKDLSHRVVLPPSHDELFHLAATFNHMLGSLEAEQNRLSLAFEAAEMGWWEWNIKADTHRWSPGFERLLGMQPGTFRGGSEAFLEQVYPEDRPRVRQLIEESTQGQLRPREFEYRVLRGGQVYWVASRARVFYDQEGKPSRLIGVELDITASQQAAQRASLLQSLTAQLSSALTPQQVAQVVLEQGLPAIGARAGLVVMRDGPMLEILALKNYLQADQQRWTRFPISGSTPLGRAMQTRQAVWVASREEFAQVFGTPPSSDTDGLDQAWAALPLLVEGQPIGGIGITYSNPQAFDSPERTFALTLADLCAGALERAKLYEAERSAREHWQQSLARLERIQTITEKLLLPLNPEQVFGVILHDGLDVLGGTAGVLRLASPDGSSLQTVAVISPNEEIARVYRDVSLEADIPSAEAARTQELLFFPSKEALLERYPHLREVVDKFVTQASVYLPLLTPNGLLGTLTLDFPHKPDLDEDERGYLMSLGRITAQALERARLYEAERRSNAQFQAILDNLPVGLALFDRELRFVRLNPALAEINQLPPEAHLGHKPSELGLAIGQFIESKLEQVFRTGQGIYNLELSGPSLHDPEDIHYSLASWYPIKLEGQTILVGASVLDITLRKRAEEAVRASEARYRALVEVGGTAVWLTDATGELVWANASFSQLTGLTLESAKAQGWLEVIHPEDRELARAAWEHSLEAGVPYEVEIRLRCTGGEYCYVHSKAVPVRGEDGHIKEWIGADTNITLRKQAEEALKESEQRLSLALESGRMGAWDWDLRSGTEQWSPEQERLFGLEPASTTHTIGDFFSLVHPEDRERITARAEEANQQGKTFVEDEFRVIRPDGRVIWIASRAQLHRDSSGQLVRMTGVNLDVTERKQVEQRLVALASVTSHLVEAQSTEQVRQVVLDEVVGVLGASGGGLRRLTPEGLVLEEHLLGSHASSEAIQRFTLIPLEASHPAAEVAGGGEGIFLRDAEETITRYPNLAEPLKRLTTQASAHLPLKRGEEVFGVLSLSFAQPRAWDEGERRFALTLADRAAMAFERARLYELERSARSKMERALHSLSTLQQLTARLSAALTPAEIIQTVFEQGLFAVGAAGSTVALLSPDGEELVIVDSIGHSRDLVEPWRRFPARAKTPMGEAVRSRQPIFLASRQEAQARYPEVFTAANSQHQAWALLPLMVERQVLGAISVAFSQAREFGQEEREFLGTLAQQCAQALERAQLYQNLAHSEERYRTLFESIDQGFCILEIIYDPAGQPTDYCFLEVNPTFERHTGLQGVVGKTARQLVPDLEQEWIETYARVAQTGEMLHFEQGSLAMGRWFEVDAVRVGGEDSRKVALLFTDVTERKRREANRAFLAEIQDGLARLSSAEEIMQMVGQKISTFLNTSFSYLVDVDEERDEGRLHHLWSRQGLPPLPSLVRMSEFVTGEFMRAARAGETVVVEDTQTDPRTDAAAYARLDMRSYVAVPFWQGSQWKAMLAVCDTRPRHWREDELELIRELSSRIFPRLERARAEEALKESEIRFRTLANTAPMIIWAAAPDGTITYANDQWFEFVGITPQQNAQSWPEMVLHPDDYQRCMAAWNKALSEGSTYEIEVRNRRHDGEYRWFLTRAVPIRDNSGRITQWFGTTTDIHEQKLAEEALRASETRYRALVEASTQVVWRATAEGRLLNPLERWSALTGVPPEQLKLERVLEDYVHPEDREQGSQQWWDAITAKVPLSFEQRVRRADGSYRYWAVRAAPVLEGGSVLEWVGTDSDITERRQAEERLREQLELNAAITSNATQALFMMDEQGYCTFMNPTAEKMFGYSFEEIRAKPLHDMIHHHRPDGRPYPKEECPIDRALPQNFGIREHEDVFIRRSGEFFPVLVAASPVFQGGKPVSTVIEVRDITDRKRAEQIILESEERFRSIADAAPALIWIAGLDKKRTFFNKSWLEFTGRSMAQEFSEGWMQSIHPGDLPGYLEVYNQAFLKREPFETEYRLRRHDGEYRWVVSRVMPRMTKDGEFLGLIGAAMDIHDRKQVESALRQSEHQLRQLSEAQRRFVADASHELRAPLTAIQGNLELLQRFKNMSKADREAALDEAASEASRLGRLVSDLLALARGDAGATIRQEPVDLNSLLQETFKELKQGKTTHQLKLHLLDSIVIRGDRDRLKQLAIILLDNALKYTPSGGQVELSLRQQGGKAQIQVTDTGIGIAPEDLPHVFERFFRADHSRHKAADPGGTGLGLPIAQWIVDQHHGSIRLDSELGKGTTVTVELPLVPVHDLKN